MSPHNGAPSISGRRCLFSLLVLLLSLVLASPVLAAKVLIVGDIQYALVAEVASDIQLSLKAPCREYSAADVKGKLGAVVEKEGAQIVVALGADALSEAMRLPSSVPVVYGLVVVPPRNVRANMTGVYMSPPVSEYLSLIRKHLPSLAKISVVGSQGMMKSLLGGDSPGVAAYYANSPSELVNTVNRLGDAKSLLLLPDANLLTAQAMTNIYLFSFRKNIPLLGISEANVKQGSLAALVFDPKAVGRQIGEKVQSILNGSDANDISESAPRKYNLYVNSNTAKKMGIEIPDDMLRKAKRVYQ